MNKKLFLSVLITTVVTNSYTKTENTFDPRICNRIDVHAVVCKNENCNQDNWEKICKQMTNLLKQSKGTEGMKGQVSICAFDSNEIKKEDQQEDEDTTKDKATFKPEECDMVSMNATVTKEKCTLQDWEEVYTNITALQEKIKSVEGVKGGIAIITSHPEQEENLS